MSEWTAKAAARLEDECKSGKFDKYGSAMKEAVQKADRKSTRLNSSHIL